MSMASRLALGVTIGAVLGTAAFVMSHGHTDAPLADLPAPTADVPTIDIDALVSAANAKAAALHLAAGACRAKGSKFIWSAELATCELAVNCSGCASSKHHTYAIAHPGSDPDSAARVRVDYTFQIQETLRHARDARDANKAAYAGMKAAQRVYRCERLWASADIQCDKG